MYCHKYPVHFAVKTNCPSPARGNCYNLAEGKQLMVCDLECLGGCYDNTSAGCFSCANSFIGLGDGKKRKGNDCRTNCPAPDLKVRRCWL